MHHHITQVLVLPILLVAGLGFAQSQSRETSSASSQPVANIIRQITETQKTEGHRRLDIFQGQWEVTGSVSLHGGEAALFVKGESHIEWTIDDFFMRESFSGTISMEQQHVMPIMRMEGVGMAAFDTHADTYTGVWMDNTNPRFVQARGQWSDDGSQLIFTGQTPDPLQPDVILHFVSTTTIVDDDTCTCIITTQRNGSEMLKLELAYSRME